MLVTISIGSFLIFSQVSSRDSLADKAYFKSSKTFQAYIPFYPLRPDGSALFNHEIHTRHFKIVDETRFHVSWNPMRCNHGKDEDEHHKVILSFLDNWAPETDLSAEEIRQNSISFTFKGRTRNSESKDPSRKHYYNVEVTMDGEKTNSEIRWVMDMSNAGFYIHINHGWAQITFYYKGKYEEAAFTPVLKFPADTEFMAMFANQQYDCPVVISTIDENFPTWQPGMPITKYVKGLEKEQGVQPDMITSTALGFFIICVIVIFVTSDYYTRLLTRKHVPKKRVEEPTIKVTDTAISVNQAPENQGEEEPQSAEPDASVTEVSKKPEEIPVQMGLKVLPQNSLSPLISARSLSNKEDTKGSWEAKKEDKEQAKQQPTAMNKPNSPKMVEVGKTRTSDEYKSKTTEVSADEPENVWHSTVE